MSTDSIARQPAGAPVGGQFATTAHTEPVVDLPAPPMSAAGKDLDEAWETRNRLQWVIAKATAHLIAADVLRVAPEARYLLLDEETTEYGTRVVAGSVLDENENAIADDPDEHAEEFSGTDGSHEIVDALDELTSNYDDLRHAEMCPAVTDPVARPDGKITTYRQYRIDLLAAKALYPEGGLA